MAVPDSQGFVTPHQGGSSLLALLPNCSLPVQPGVVGAGPGIAAGRDQAVAQQELGEPVPGPHEIRADVLAGPHQILGCLLRGDRDPHRVIWPSRVNRARCSASRASVFTRSPEGRWSLDGAATAHLLPPPPTLSTVSAIAGASLRLRSSPAGDGLGRSRSDDPCVDAAAPAVGGQAVRGPR